MCRRIKNAAQHFCTLRFSAISIHATFHPKFADREAGDIMSTTIYVDECGYTGEDLLSAEQPIFCLASTSLTTEECTNLSKAHMADVRSAELKHSALARSARHQGRIIALLREIAEQHSSRVKFAVAHKRYALLTKMVDLIVEPLAYEDGIDFYERGTNIAYSNMLYYLTPGMAGEKFFSEMLRNFQRMMRERTPITYDRFFKLFFRGNLPPDLKEATIFFRYSHNKHGPAEIFSVPPDSLDIACAEAFTLVAKWAEEIDGDLIIVHDQSSKMARNKKIWDRVVSPGVPERVVGWDRRLMRFPLRVTRTELANSKDHPGLQIADMLAGAMTRCMKWIISGEDPADQYAKELASFLPESFGGHMLWPSPQVTPEELGTTGPTVEDPIQHIVELIKNPI